jgi:anaerobic selenocysteine-containing dehydrogenase
VLMNPLDMLSEKLESRQVVNLVNETGGKLRRANHFLVVPYGIPKGCIATYFPEANVLVPIELTARKSNTPVSKAVPVKIEKISSGE